MCWGCYEETECEGWINVEDIRDRMLSRIRKHEPSGGIATVPSATIRRLRHIVS